MLAYTLINLALIHRLWRLAVTNSNEDYMRAIPGDWVIRCAPEKTEWSEPQYEFIQTRAPNLQKPIDYTSFTDHAIYVIDVTRTHMTVHDPLFGRPVIFQIHEMPGSWHLATMRQVEMTWILAGNVRERGQSMQLQIEKQNMPYRMRPV